MILRPIVDLTPKPSRIRRLRAWLLKPCDAPLPYRAQPCESDLARVIGYAVIALVVVLLIVAWVFLA